jgi:hypothetical protein
MSAGTATVLHPAAAEPPPASAADARAQIDEQLAMLKRVAEVGMALTLQIEGQARGEVPEGQAPAALGDLALAYSRAARALRLTVMLQSRLMRDREGIDGRAEIKARTAAAFEQARRSDPAYVHKTRVERIVERVAREACGEDEAALDRLMTDAVERLDDEDLYGAVLDRPVGELVALICRDLGLDPDWARLSEEAWAKAEARSGLPGSPFHPASPIAAAMAGGGPPAEERAADGAGGPAIPSPAALARAPGAIVPLPASWFEAPA